MWRKSLDSFLSTVQDHRVDLMIEDSVIGG